jgi:hypothetical protein
MAVDPGEGIYRAMIEDKDGLPLLGLTALKLGVRIGVDIVPDQTGMVYLPAFRPHEPNGLSCSTTIKDLPVFALPVEWGGTNTKTVVWQIEASDLGPELIAQEGTPPQAKGRHLSAGPSGPMLFAEYLRAIQGTRTRWKKVTRSTP